MSDLAALHPVSRAHLEAMTDEIGIHQHARGSTPDPAHGYCVDDVARALQVDLLHALELGWTAVAASAWRNFEFLAQAFDGPSGRFRNFRSVDGSWIGGVGSEDCHGRAMLALGETISAALDGPLTQAATELFLRALPASRGLTAIRAEASVMLGCAAMLDVASNDAVRAALTDHADRLATRYRARAVPAWPWPEPMLTYENALLPRASIVAGRSLGSAAMIARGVRSLDWLIGVQTAADGHLSPIGNGWWPQDGPRSRFDQQPIEMTALLMAAGSALATTGRDRYGSTIDLAYAWFMGANDLGLPLVDPRRGSGCDGLTPRGVNTNEGAESTLMWLMALEHTRAHRKARHEASAKPPGTFALASR